MKRRAAIPLLASPAAEPLVHYATIKSGLVLWRAWFYPHGHKAWAEELLGEFLTQELAQAACDAHAAGRRA